MQIPPKPKYPAPPLKNSATEADAALVARIWRERGPDAAVLAMFMVQWHNDMARWESMIFADRVRTLYHA